MSKSKDRTSTKVHDGLAASAAAMKYGWQGFELDHALGALGHNYGDETVVKTFGGKELRSPVYPKSCNYVRVVQDGFELAYWDAEEWREDPREVMGAIIGAIHG